MREVRLGGLRPSTTYELQVKTLVGGGDETKQQYSSSWSIIALATTKDARMCSAAQRASLCTQRPATRPTSSRSCRTVTWAAPCASIGRRRARRTAN